MPADAITYQYLSKELDNTLSGGIIAKIAMPYPDEVILTVRNDGKTFQLLLSAAAACPRVHLTEEKYVSPLHAPAFLMHLRKHIGSAKILKIDTQPYERVLRLYLSGRNELGISETKTLYAEMMGRYSNLILVNADGRISDCVKKVTADISSKRTVLPGLQYLPAPPQDKSDISQPDLLRKRLAAFPGGKISSYIIKNLSGLSPATVNECVFRAIGKEEAPALTAAESGSIVAALIRFYDFADARPCVLTADGLPIDFGIRPYLTIGNGNTVCATLSAAMERYYVALDKKNRFDAGAHAVATTVKSALRRAENRLAEFTETREQSADYEHERLYGELITANIYRLKKNMTEFTADNYYTGGQETVRLDPALTPQLNAQKYYKRASKKKKAYEMAGDAIREAAETIDYLQSVLESLREGTEASELDDIREELTRAGILRVPLKKNKKRFEASRPKTYMIDGFTVRVGKNNLQNDALTRSARPDDIWLHAQKIHGSHTVITTDGQDVPDEVILRAAEICAFYSAARLSENVPIDYTRIRHVSKPSGARPGMVIYTDQKTVYVKPRDMESV